MFYVDIEKNLFSDCALRLASVLNMFCVDILENEFSVLYNKL